VKLTKSKLIKIIKEELDKSISEGHGGEGSMARSQLARTAELAAMLGDMITDESNLEEWVESKITKAQDYLTTVMNYMRGSELTDESKDFLKENLGGYFGGIDPVKLDDEPAGPPGTVSRVRSSELDEKVAELVDIIGENEFIDRLVQMTPDEQLNKVIQSIAKEKQLTLGGIKYLEEELTEAYSEKQRKWACAQMGKSRKNFKGKKKLSKKEAEEMCKSEVEEK